MRIALLGAGTTQITNKELETAVHKIGFTCTGAMPVAEGFAGVHDIDEMMEQVMGSAKVTITKQDGFSTQTLHQGILLRELAELSAFNEGVVAITRIYNDADAAANVVTIEFSVEVALDSALRLSDNAKLMFHLEDKPSASIFDIEVIDHPINSTEYVKYETKFVNANVAKDFSVEQNYGIALPVDDIVTLELHYNNGKVVKFNKSEAKRVLRDSQDTIYLTNGQTTMGFHNWAVFTVQDCYKVTVTLGQSTNFYLLQTSKA